MVWTSLLALTASHQNLASFLSMLDAHRTLSWSFNSMNSPINLIDDIHSLAYKGSIDPSKAMGFTLQNHTYNDSCWTIAVCGSVLCSTFSLVWVSTPNSTSPCLFVLPLYCCRFLIVVDYNCMVEVIYFTFCYKLVITTAKFRSWFIVSADCPPLLLFSRTIVAILDLWL